MKKLFALLSILAVLVPAGVYAQGIERQRLRFAPGSTQSVITDEIAGRQTVDYIVSARRGQTISIRFAPSSGAAFFNLLAPSGDALFVGQAQGNPGRYTARLGVSGDYAIRVYLVRAAARRGESASFRLTVSITGGAATAPAPEDPGVAEDGGPDFYVVAGLRPGDRLNMRRAPSASSPVVASFPNGTDMRNLGCRRTATQRWCNVESTDTSGQRGWVNGKFLRESAGPDVGVERPDDATVPGTNFNATGEVDCAIAGYPRVRSCPFGVNRGRGQDSATVVISLPDGERRVFAFEGGQVRAISGVSAFRYAQSGDSWFLNVNNGDERYTVDDAVINGG
ncbi:MAG: SH3 domain-containing protein [Rhizobiaceae bacterium]